MDTSFKNLRPNLDAANFPAEKLLDQLVVVAALKDHPVVASALVGVADQVDSRKDHHEVDTADNNLEVVDHFVEDHLVEDHLAEPHPVVVMILSTELEQEDLAAVVDPDVDKEAYPLADRTEEEGS